MTEPSKPEQKLPRGVYALALLLFLAGGVMLLAAIILPIQGTNLAPWYIYLLYAAYLLLVGWGLWGAKRWAYLATLLMCVVLSYYLFQASIVLQQNTLFQFLGLVIIFGYLLQPKVRAAFLRPSVTAESAVANDEVQS